MGSCESSEKSHKEARETETEVKTDEAVKAVAVVAGVAFVVWASSKLLGLSTSNGGRKKMKAPGRDAHIYRDGFEHDPLGYFRNLRDD